MAALYLVIILAALGACGLMLMLLALEFSAKPEGLAEVLRRLAQQRKG